jgi:hypothetical protein
MGVDVVRKVAPVAQEALSDHDRGGVQNVAQNTIGGGYTQGLKRIPGFDKLRQSMTLARRPGNLNPLIELKNQTANQTAIIPRSARSYVEEIN